MFRPKIMTLLSPRAAAGFVIALLVLLLWPGVASWTGPLTEALTKTPIATLIGAGANSGADTVSGQSSHTVSGTAQAQAPPAEGTSAPSGIVLTYGVGGVLTADGTLWQYRPDQNEWLTIDEAFRGEGRTTSILPLPVPVEKIADMATFGFIITKSGGSYLYDLNANEWKQLPQPQ